MLLHLLSNNNCNNDSFQIFKKLVCAYGDGKYKRLKFLINIHIFDAQDYDRMSNKRLPGIKINGIKFHGESGIRCKFKKKKNDI